MRAFTQVPILSEIVQYQTRRVVTLTYKELVLPTVSTDCHLGRLVMPMPSFGSPLGCRSCPIFRGGYRRSSDSIQIQRTRLTDVGQTHITSVWVIHDKGHINDCYNPRAVESCPSNIPEQQYMQEGINEIREMMYNNNIGQSILETTYRGFMIGRSNEMIKQRRPID
jgi:hypothetical protein